MVDVEALKRKFAGYPNIIAHIEKAAAEGKEGLWTLERFERMKVNEADQTVSHPDDPTSFKPLDELDAFIAMTLIGAKNVEAGRGWDDCGDDEELKKQVREQMKRFEKE